MSIAISIMTISLLVALLVTPLVAKLAYRFDMLDRPDGHRKLHSKVTPLGGGMAVLIGYGAALGLIYYYCLTQPIEGFDTQSLFGLIAATLVVAVTGVIDDKWGIRGRQKLAGQALAAITAVAFGLQIQSIELFGVPIQLGVLAIPFTMGWLVVTTNALNLIDGVDGLATTLGIIYCMAFAVMAWLTGHLFDAFCGLALAGSLAGFAAFNLPPARIFLGDAGSMLIGFTLGILSIRSCLKGPTSFAMVGPCLVLAIPAFDVCMAVLRRKLTGRSIYATDRGHLHHVLQRLNYGPRRTVLFVGGLAVICSVAAIVSVFTQNEWLAAFVLLSILAGLVLSRTFGFHECKLLLTRISRVGGSLLTLRSSEPGDALPIVTQMNGRLEWERLWSALVEFSQVCGIQTIQFNVSSPSIGEEYHACWESPHKLSVEHRQWKTEIPLFADDINVGQLVLTGQALDGATFLWLSELLEGLKPFELQMRDLLEMDRVDEQDLAASTSIVRPKNQSASTV
ncbi:MraY family glycosyltransferase [Blastopirellula marina]|uniref:Putative undecaprenyl-phosphate N-acetylglucosaminyltransferase n=1 Tax=Blastopirellula marina DSM 3645 TaxID=314230 RepID=A3ZP79_9BACT|nr:MraY family glycosyltransferase [Blastopirellula marina]EAQ81557.1 putative undecaprenyl-phosphate N-acetylglucosaminyltransferase [Blastopirellula marina DSM 3645]